MMMFSILLPNIINSQLLTQIEDTNVVLSKSLNVSTF